VGDTHKAATATDLSVASIILPADLQSEYLFTFIMQDSDRRQAFSSRSRLSRNSE
jgi:hypothetical protein